VRIPSGGRKEVTRLLQPAPDETEEKKPPSDLRRWRRSKENEDKLDLRKREQPDPS
jgi:hypothetical protein